MTGVTKGKHYKKIHQCFGFCYATWDRIARMTISLMNRAKNYPLDFLFTGSSILQACNPNRTLHYVKFQLRVLLFI